MNIYSVKALERLINLLTFLLIPLGLPNMKNYANDFPLLHDLLEALSGQ